MTTISEHSLPILSSVLPEPDAPEQRRRRPPSLAVELEQRAEELSLGLNTQAAIAAQSRAYRGEFRRLRARSSAAVERLLLASDLVRTRFTLGRLRHQAAEAATALYIKELELTRRLRTLLTAAQLDALESGHRGPRPRFRLTPFIAAMHRELTKGPNASAQRSVEALITTHRPVLEARYAAMRIHRASHLDATDDSRLASVRMATYKLRQAELTVLLEIRALLRTVH